MPRIAGINIPENKKIGVSLTYVFGVGSTLSKKILDGAKIDAEKMASKLTPQEVNSLREILEKRYRVEGDLRRDRRDAIKRLRDIGTWRGSRHAKQLPVRGQTTKNNSRTVRGNKRKTMGSGRKGAPAPK